MPRRAVRVRGSALSSDPYTSRNIAMMDFNAVTRLAAKTGATVVFVTHSIGEAVYISDLVVVFSKRPAVIADFIPVALSYPRSAEIRYSAEFTALEHRAGRALRITR